jgi:hypothetical protein
MSQARLRAEFSNDSAGHTCEFQAKSLIIRRNRHYLGSASNAPKTSERPLGIVEAPR